MNIGISSSCFYPTTPEVSLERLGKMGVKTSEIFLNTPSETTKEFSKKLCEIIDRYGMNIVSFHPYMSFAEGFFIFSNYERRFEDSLEMYKPIFETAARVGAKYYVLHGSKEKLMISPQEYAQRFEKFSDTAKSFGICVAHENVNAYVGQDPHFLAYLKSVLGNKFKAVLDVKQARRCGADVYEYIDLLQDSIVHLHLSDCKKDSDCLPPSQSGEFDFKRLFEKLKSISYKGDAVIEVYSHNFEKDEELFEAMNYLKSLESNII